MSPQYKCEGLQGGGEMNSVGGGKGGASEESIHVIISCDGDHFPGVVALLTSILANSRSVERLQLHVVLAEVTETSLRQYLQCHPPFPHHVSLDIIQLDPRLLEGRVHVYSPEEEVGKLSSLGNFARFFFHEMLPAVKKALYLDADTIVQGDIAELWDHLQNSDQLLLAAPRYVMVEYRA